MDTNQPNQPESQTSGYSNQPPTGGAPYQPPQQQQQQPYGYQQAPPPPPAQKKGFNWLACCGITCLVLVIIGGGMAFCTYQFVAPFLGMGMEMASIQEEVIATDVSVMRSGAVAVDTATLFTNSADFKGSWLEITGEVVQEDSDAVMSADTVASGEFVTYVLENNVFLMDVTNTPSTVSTGDTIKAYGKCFGWDLMELEKIPIFGKSIADEMRKDPQFAGNTKMVFFVGKGIELVEGGGGASGESAEGSEGTGGDGWVR